MGLGGWRDGWTDEHTRTPPYLIFQICVWIHLKYSPANAMLWIDPTEKDTAAATLESHLHSATKN